MCGGGEHKFLCVHLFCRVCNIYRVVSDALKIAYRMQEFRCFAALFLRQLASCQFDKVCSEFVFVAVENLFFCLNLAVALFGVPVKQVHRSGKVLSRFSRHRTNRFVALFKRYCGVGEESFFEFVYIVRVFFVVRLVLEYESNYLFKHFCERHKHNDSGKSEKRVHQRNGDHVHFHIHEGETTENRIRSIEYRCPYNDAENVNKQIYKRGSFARNARSES